MVSIAEVPARDCGRLQVETIGSHRTEAMRDIPSQTGDFIRISYRLAAMKVPVVTASRVAIAVNR
jgi:hypothetical protein